MSAELAAAIARRDAVLSQDNLPAFIAYASEQGVRFSCDEAAEIAMHKMRTAIRALPEELRTRSKKWLQAGGTKHGTTAT
jgi:hypothetical protein